MAKPIVQIMGEVYRTDTIAAIVRADNLVDEEFGFAVRQCYERREDAEAYGFDSEQARDTAMAQAIANWLEGLA